MMVVWLDYKKGDSYHKELENLKINVNTFQLHQ